MQNGGKDVSKTVEARLREMTVYMCYGNSIHGGCILILMQNLQDLGIEDVSGEGENDQQG